MGSVNKPRVSKIISTTCLVAVVFMAGCTGFFTYATFFTPIGIFGLPAVAVALLVEMIMLLILASIYKTEYVLTDEELIIKTTGLIGGNKHIRLKDVVRIEKILIPFGVRLFGASFHGRYYHLPGLGKAFVTITNFSDGVLIRTKHGNWIITPRRPEEFVHAVKPLMASPNQNERIANNTSSRTH